MPLYWKNKFALIIGVGLFLIGLNCSAQGAVQSFQIQENLVCDSLINYILPDCWAIIVLSKDQCSHCSSGMPALVDILEEQGRSVIFVRVVDENLMDCKTTEMEMREVMDSSLVFEYIPNKTVFISDNSEKIKTFSFETTPYLIYNSVSDILKMVTDEITDKYGGLQKSISKKNFSCRIKSFQSGKK